ncbi:MAG: biotin--[acetyl-CoA-carboxylase] ligase [Deltaproteobacteria bacterium]|nr:biotin--[acetyl-CoA-carboxylase] ligase [Deltaproteobacteria bacterium]
MPLQNISSKNDNSFRIEHFPEVASTNTTVLEKALAGEPEGYVAVALEQTGGKGRLGRKWEAQPGGLWMSLLLRPGVPLAAWGGLNLIASLAVQQAIHSLTELPVSIKWPNDLLIDGKKVCGMLMESHFAPGGNPFLIWGIGVNVQNDIPAELTDTATSLAQAGASVAAAELRDGILSHLAGHYTRFHDDPPYLEEIHRNYLTHSATLGSRVKVIMSQGQTLTGTAVDLDPEGRLWLQTDTGLEKILAGDVVHLRPEDI